MKKPIFTFLILSMFSLNIRPATFEMGESTTHIKIVIQEYNNMLAFENLILAIRITESRLNDFAIGKADDTGPLQITPILVKDYNQRTGKDYKIIDCFNYGVSKEIFQYYASKIGIIPSNFERIARIWNRGEGNWKDEKGLNYWNLVQKHLNKIQSI